MHTMFFYVNTTSYVCRMSGSRGEYGHEDIDDAFDEVVVTQTESPNHFSSLLWMPHQQHRISLISENVSY